MTRTVVTEEDKTTLKAIALEICAIRKLINQLAEILVNLSDKDLMRIFGVGQDDFRESQVDRYEAKLEQQFNVVEKEFQP